jgi:hypothetical protein
MPVTGLTMERDDDDINDQSDSYDLLKLADRVSQC